MKRLPIAVLACAAILGACSVKEERTVQQPAPATSTVVATPAPSTGTVVYSNPTPATSTTVYTR
jgi:hypothetical protein